MEPTWTVLHDISASLFISKQHEVSELTFESSLTCDQNIGKEYHSHWIHIAFHNVESLVVVYVDALDFFWKRDQPSLFIVLLSAKWAIRQGHIDRTVCASVLHHKSQTFDSLSRDLDYESFQLDCLTYIDPSAILAEYLKPVEQSWIFPHWLSWLGQKWFRIRTLIGLKCLAVGNEIFIDSDSPHAI